MPRATRSEGRPILDRLPVGILVYRLNNLIYANRAFLDWTGYANAGGADRGRRPRQPVHRNQGRSRRRATPRTAARSLTITTVNGKQKPVEGRLFSVAWNNENALVLMISTQARPTSDSKARGKLSLRRIEAENQRARGDPRHRHRRRAGARPRRPRALGQPQRRRRCSATTPPTSPSSRFGDLFAPESRRGVLDHLDRLARNGGPESLDAGREAIGLVRQGGLVPLYITMGRIADGEKFCAVLRDITAWKRTEEELINAKQEAEKASTAKSEFLAKISHEIRTPLNAIIGFSEVMMDERFGPVGNERYRQYLKDIHASGGHLISLLNDLLDLSKIEAGKLELTFVSVNLNDLVQQCVAIMQQQANRERVIIRTSLPAELPQIVADARSVRQIALNSAVELDQVHRRRRAGDRLHRLDRRPRGGAARARHRRRHEREGIADRARAVPPARHLGALGRRAAPASACRSPRRWREANHARFRITSQVEDGTLVEVAFPATRVLAQ